MFRLLCVFDKLPTARGGPVRLGKGDTVHSCSRPAKTDFGGDFYSKFFFICPRHRPSLVTIYSYYRVHTNNNRRRNYRAIRPRADDVAVFRETVRTAQCRTYRPADRRKYIHSTGFDRLTARTRRSRLHLLHRWELSLADRRGTRTTAAG